MEKSFESKNYYELLGVPQTATEKEIKLAYRDIALVYHPDSHFFDEIVGEQDKANNSKIFARVTEAYHTLVNPVLRAKYDESLPPELPEWEEDEEVSEFDTIDKKTQQYILDPARPKTFGNFGHVEEDQECIVIDGTEEKGILGFIKKIFKK